MTADVQISTVQLKKLQTLYSQWAATSTDPRTKTREERLLWASIICNRDVKSFCELTGAEAKRAIDTLQRQLGTSGAKARRSGAGDGTAKAVPLQGPEGVSLQGHGVQGKRRMNREQALRYGKDGAA